MVTRRSNKQRISTRSSRASVGLITVLLLLSGGIYAKKQRKAEQQLDQQKRALHVLDRLTFGPRPGDVERLASTDIDQWIELQLHPEKIDNGALQARLATYRTLQMSTRELALAFPPTPIAKAVMDGKLPMPSAPYTHAIYVAAIDRVQGQQSKKQDASALAAPAAQSAQPQIVNAAQAQRQQVRREAPSLVDQLSLLPPDARMQKILGLPVDEQRDLTKGGIPYPKRTALLTGLSPEQRETVLALNSPEGVVNSELQSAKLLRAVYSDRQLEEVLTDFWFNHFNIFLNKGADRYMVTSYERDVIRPHVLGKFKDMLVATAKSPAMLFYLDNWQSEGPNSDAAMGRPEHPQMPPSRVHPPRANGPFGPHPGTFPNPRPPAAQKPPGSPANQAKRRDGLNENYARELMELHTLGVNGGYTQKDVTEVARAFTGWTLTDPREGGDFVFKPRLHEPGTKVILGHKIKEGGEKEGMQVLELLARNPSTARFISTELAQRFVSDNPPPSLVDAMSKTFLKTDGDLRQVMRTMLRSQEFWAPEAYRARVKTPLEFVASALRATDADITDPQPLLGNLNKMGMQLYGMLPPTGYSTKADVWVNSAALLDRMNFGLALGTNHMPGVSVDLAGLTGGSSAPAAENDAYQAQVQLEQVLLSGEVSKQTHDTIEQQITSQTAVPQKPTPQARNVNVIIGLLLGSPEFQRK